MIRTLLGKWGIGVLRIMLGAVFFYAGVSKMREPPWIFEAGIASFHLVPDACVSLMAASLPFFEAMAGFWLMLGWRHRPAALAIFILSFIFTIALGQAAMRGLDVNCGCFGSESSLPTPLGIAFARDLLLLAVSGFIYFGNRECPANNAA